MNCTNEISKNPLIGWLKETHSALQSAAFAPSPITNLTILSYFFWNDNRIHSEFWKIETAFLHEIENILQQLHSDQEIVSVKLAAVIVVELPCQFVFVSDNVRTVLQLAEYFRFM